MILNSNDIFQQIGLIVNPKQDLTFVSEPKYTAYIEIQLGEDENYVLEVKENDDPYQLSQQFCKKHHLNRLAIGIVEEKIIQAKQNELAKLKNKANRTKNHSRKESLVSKSKSITPQKRKTQKPKGQQDNLYMRSLVKARITEEERHKKKMEQQIKQKEQLTFKPKINHVSQKIVQFLRKQNIPKTKEKKLTPPKKMYEQMKDCTFKPKINKVSNMIVNNRSARQEEVKKFNEQYGQKKEKSQNKIKRQYQQTTFKPKINTKSTEKIIVPFFKRLQLAIEKKKANQSNHHEDECSFRPKIGRPPKYTRNKQNLPVWDHLHRYNSRKQMNTHMCSIEAKANNYNIQNKKNYYESLVQSRIKGVFELLDTNNDGKISPDEIGIQKLTPNSLLFLKPIFIEMDELEATLDYNDFRKAVLALMNDSDPAKKGAFLSEKWWGEQKQEETFIPEINPRSKEIVANRGNNDLYEQGVRQLQSREYRLERERAIKQQKQLAECSFKPTLSHTSKYYIEKILSHKDLKLSLLSESMEKQ